MILDRFKNKFEESVQKALMSLDLDTIDDILDSRDSDVFSNPWTKAWENVEDKNLDIDSDRERLFKMIYDKTESSDLAAYVTEDFELIAKHIDEEENNWVNTVCKAYFSFVIPHGELSGEATKLTELIVR